MAVTYLRLFDPTQQFQLKSGALNVAGRLRVYLESTDDLAPIFDENGVQLAQPAILDNNGRCRGLFVDSEKSYRLEVCDRFDNLLYTIRKMTPCGGGGGSVLGGVEIVSTDGSISIDKFEEGGATTYDIGIAPSDSPEFLEWSTGFRGNMTYGTDKVPNYSAGTMSFDQYGVMVYKDRYYHITNKFYIKPSGTGTNYETFEVALMLRDPSDGTAISVEIRKWDIDTSLTDEVQVEMSFDLTPSHDGELYWEFYDNSLEKFEHTDAWIQIHRVYSGINAVPDTCATKQWVSSNYQPLSGMSSYVAYSAIEHNGDGAISGINGSAIVGELDTDTVSAIASSYAESAASSKQDISAMTGYATTGDLLSYVPGSAYTAYTAHVEADKLDASASSGFYPTSNPSGFITGVAPSSLSSLIDYSALEYDGSGHISGISGSAIGGQGGTDSATVSAIASAYAESAASGKLDNSASSTWYPTSNPSGYLTAHQDISNKLDVSAFNAYSADVDSALADKLDVTAYDASKYQSEYRPWGTTPTSGSLVMEQSHYPRMVQAIVSGTAGSATAGIIPPVPAQDPEAVRVLVAASGSLADVAWRDVNTYVSGKADASAMTSYMPYSSLGYSGTVITSIDGSAIGGQGGEGHTYTGIYPVNVDNTADTISVDNIPLCLETPLTARESAGSAIIGIDLTNYATTAYVDSSISSKADSSALADKLDKTAEVVTATATQLYAGTNYLVSVNNTAISAARAGNAANAALATSAWYDGTGRYISALPDSATVSAIASSYAESAASSKADSSALADYYTTGNISGFVNSTTVSSIAAGYARSAASSKQDSSAMSSYALSADVSSTISTVATNSASWASTIETASATSYKQNGTQLVTFTGVASADSKPLIAQTIQAGAVQSIGTANFFYGPSAKPFTANTAGIYSPLQYATGACLAMDGGTYRAYYKGNEWFISDYGTNRSGAVRAEVHATRGVHISGSNTAGVGFDLITSGLNFTDNTGSTSMTPANIAEWKSCESTVSTQSANWGGSALALSAGPGVKLEKVGDVLVASTDETVLWSGSAVMSANVTLPLNDDVTKYRYIDIYSMPHYTNHIPEMMRISTEYMSGNTDAKGSYTVIAHAGGGGMRFNNAYMRIVNYTSIQLNERQQVSLIGSAISTATPQNSIVKVVGVCKTAEV